MNIKIVTVFGANGTMGANISAIFASFGNAKVYMVCRDKGKCEEAVNKAVQSVKAESIRDRLFPCTYDDLEICIRESDLIYESLSEDLNIKRDLFTKIKPFIKSDAIIATGTSGLSISELSKSFEDLSNGFLGIHMFNPPYNLPLCEVVLHSEHQKLLSADVKEYLVQKLRRTVVEVKDSPSFLGNRIGFFFINEALNLAEENMDDGGIDYIDAIIGGYTGRSMSPLLTADFVGLDTTLSIIDYISDNTDDEYNNSFLSPKYLRELVDNKMLGRKVNVGLYKRDKETKETYVYDIREKTYRLKNDFKFNFANEMIDNIKVGDYKNAFNILIGNNSKEALICKKILLKYIVYSLKISLEVSDDISSCDDAMATGYSWIPPLALMEAFGGANVVKSLVHELLGEEYIAIIDNQEVFSKIPSKSKYNYAPFLKAKY